MSDGLLRSWTPGFPVDLFRTLGPLRRGSGDPTFRIDEAGAIWRAVRTPVGPGTLRLTANPAPGEVVGRAWGPGSAWLLEQLPAMCGALDDPGQFRPEHPLLRDAVARYPGFRLTRAGQVIDVLVPSVLEQKTTGRQARASFRELVHRFGEPAPGPASGLVVPPSPEQWALVPSWEWHRAGVEPPQSRAVVTAVRHAGRLEQTLTLGTAVADQRLRAVPGIGVWTSAEVRQRAFGDPDAVTIGDYHLPATIGHALTGERVDDAGMLELLAPFAGHRYRACALISMSVGHAPRRGPRITIQDHRGH